MKIDRILCWFSCGAASAVATKKAIEFWGDEADVIPVNCDTRPSEHPDNYRFCIDMEKWFGRSITFIQSDKYETVDEVFEETRYMAGINGARCTTELKKLPRHAFARPDDIHVFGFTCDFKERNRARDFTERNPELILRWPLIDHHISKNNCYDILKEAGIKLPMMYRLGFNNNNCPGCVKASSPWYWSMIRTHFPDVFQRRSKQSRELGVRLVEITSHERIFLDELLPGPFKRPVGKEDLSCGPECGGSYKRKGMFY